jgi:hypothetical protein
MIIKSVEDSRDELEQDIDHRKGSSYKQKPVDNNDRATILNKLESCIMETKIDKEELIS